ncbi:type 1 fimbria pilin [Paraburkholderia sp. BL27I4N3]|uniref:fimbrial protein n=1 Tax=Paraburkholderia sp. BL27I4N3 TaxID=1938805 RepID=UPI000E36575D|nr:fimbrial protein [Paraburkholderia sp. BL27I4N3]REE23258.1 type 1 fimbria pilin [Paraburkholderia sp. BL27I4N3]
MMRKQIFAPHWLMRALVLLALAAGWSVHAYAECPTSSGLPATFTYGSIAVSDSAAVGDVIPGTVQGFTFIGKCSASSLFDQPIVACPASGTAVPGMTGVYPTNVAGVGMRMRDANGKPMVGTGSCSTDSQIGTTGADGSFNVSGTFELVKTGPVTGGSITGASYNSGILRTGTTLNNDAATLSVANNTPVRGVTCSVTSASANQTIPLATTSPAAFPTGGSVDAKTPFSLGLNCQSGVKVAVTFSSTSGSSGVASVLANAGSATGIGVQLLDASQSPLALDAALSLTSSTTGNMSFQFFSQYYRLGGAPVVAGTVRATAIFTMSYQ